MLRLWTSAAPLLALIWGTRVMAQSAVPPGPDGEPSSPRAEAQATASVPPGHQPALRVVVQGAQANLDDYRVQQAIERELGVVVRGDDQPGVVGTLTVTTTGPDALEMAYQGKDGRRSMRTVTLPADTDRRVDTVALVAGNLVRDETGELIEALRPALKPGEATAPEAPPVEPAPTSAATPAVAATKPALDEQPPDEASDGERAVPDLPSKPLNLSLFHPVAIYSDSHELGFYAELGLGYSYVGRVTGASVTGLVSRLRYGFSGVQVAGLVGMTSGPSHGFSLAGIVGYQTGSLDGGLVGGAVTWAKGDLAGADLAGVLAVRQGRSSGVQVAGAVAIGRESDGAQIGGALTLSREVTGLQLAGAVNGAERVRGVMLAGALNVASERASGLQLGTVNVAQSFRGVQLGIINVARQAEGVQVGLVNVAQKVDGASVGLIPIAGNGSQHLVFWTTPGVALGNIGAKFRVGPYYSILGFGYDPDGDGPDRALPAAAMGGQYDVSPLYVACDVLVQSSFKASEFRQNDTFVSLRPQLGVRVLPWLAAFGGVAIVSGPHDDNWNDDEWTGDLKVRAVAGLELF